MNYFRFTISILLIVFAFVSPAQALTPNDSLFFQQWYLNQVGARDAWDTTTGKESVVVAVLDTGVDLDHPDLAANIWTNKGEIAKDGVDNDRNGFIDDIHGWNFVENIADTNPQSSANASLEAMHHGTLIAGIIAAIGNNAQGVTGLGWNTKIMPVRVLSSIGSGDDRDVIAGIDYAIRNGAHIINLSFVTFETGDDFSTAIERARNAGVIVVAAMGNDMNGGVDTDKTPIYPACFDGPAGQNWVLGVAATDQRDQKTDFSNYGSRCVDLSAPGEMIYSTQFANPTSAPGDFYGGNWAGTSLATPIVSGIAALVRSVSPHFRRADIIDILLDSADQVDDLNPSLRGKLGQGRVNAATAVSRARIAASKRTTAPTLAVASDQTGPPRVWLFNNVGTLISAFMAYDESFDGGVYLTAFDLDDDEEVEIITTPGPGAGPHVKIWNEQGRLENDFFAFDSSDRHGITVAAGDVDGDGEGEIVVGAGPGALPLVRVFSRWGILESEFYAFDADMQGGVEVAVGDTDGGTSEIIVGVQDKNSPQVRVFDGRGNLKGQFLAFEETYYNGVRLGAIDVGGRVGDEILIARGGGESVLLHQVRANGLSWNSIVTFAEDQEGPLAITARKKRGEKAEIFVAGGKHGQFPYVHGFNPIGALLYAFPVPQELGTSLRIAAL